MEDFERSAVEARRMIGCKELSPVELVRSHIQRIERLNPVVNAFVQTCFEESLTAAREAEDAVMRGASIELLHGLPIGIKDLQHAKGLKTTFGSLTMKDHRPDDDDRAIRAIRDAGAIVIGKTNTTEFGAGSNTTNELFGPTLNPFNLERTSGGSSGGSTAALATGMVPLCTGSDTGGSLRIPSTFCGTVAIRPSLGAVPFERRAFPLWPFQVVGPMARTVEDTAPLFAAMAKFDHHDAMSFALSGRPANALPATDLSGIRMAFSPDLGFAPTSAMIRRVFTARMEKIAPHFANSREAFPDLSSAPQVNWILRAMQFRLQHRERYETSRDQIGYTIRLNYEQSLEISVDDILWALDEQRALCARMAEFLDEVDVLICPGATITPFMAKDLFPKSVDGATQSTYVAWAGLTNGLSVAGNPVVSLPSGLDEEGLPFGIQIVGRRGSDWDLLRTAHALESVLARDPETARPTPDTDRLAAAGGA